MELECKTDILSQITITQLKLICQQLELDFLGTKNDIMKRLSEYHDFDKIIECINDYELEKSISSISIRY